MTWVIAGDPTDESNFEKDASIWVWTIERDDDQRYVEVTITMPALANAGIDAQVRQARESRGRSAVEMHLNEDVPPRRILVSTYGVEPNHEQ